MKTKTNNQTLTHSLHNGGEKRKRKRKVTPLKLNCCHFHSFLCVRIPFMKMNASKIKSFHFCCFYCCCCCCCFALLAIFHQICFGFFFHIHLGYFYFSIKHSHMITDFFFCKFISFSVVVVVLLHHGYDVYTFCKQFYHCNNISFDLNYLNLNN